ncbi:hypothetical protein [Pectobacterium wasabiae]|uniref:hypothetical protein n=1 Tax=Pectobacterium wasabiae TaxID=55208 RepID=UPI0002E2D8B9|nr:hypothetical protein [Pectobacterium wasabiae]
MLSGIKLPTISLFSGAVYPHTAQPAGKEWANLAANVLGNMERRGKVRLSS